MATRRQASRKQHTRQCEGCGVTMHRPPGLGTWKARRCATCRHKVKLHNQRAFYDRRKKAQVCDRCSRPALPGQMRCARHAIQNADRVGDIRERRVAASETIPLSMREQWMHEDIWEGETPLHLLPLDEYWIRWEEMAAA